MVFIISDAYNAAKYAKKSHEFFLENSRIARIDFCSDIPLFEAGVSNTIPHFAKTKAEEKEKPIRVRRWGAKPEDFDSNADLLPTFSQAELGTVLFRKDGTHAEQIPEGAIVLEKLCYISKGMVIHADEREYQAEFTTDDLLADKQ